MPWADGDRLDSATLNARASSAASVGGFSTNTLHPESGATLSVGTTFLVGPSIDSGGRVLDARAFGVVGDNSTNDAPFIQAAINRAYDLGGGVVYLPGGNYRLDSGLSMHATSTLQVILRGQGRRDTLLRPMASVHTALTIGTLGASTFYPVIEDVTITGANVSSHTGCGIHGISVQHGTMRRVNIEEFDGDGGTGLYLEGATPSAVAPHYYRNLLEQVIVATTARPVYMENADENDFLTCNFLAATGRASATTVLEIRQGRNNRFFGTVLQGDTTLTPAYTGLYVASPTVGDNAHNQFHGLVSEGHKTGVLIESGITGTTLIGYHGSICSSFYSDGGDQTMVLDPYHQILRWPSGSNITPAWGFSSEASLGFYRSGASVLAVSRGQLAVTGGSASTPSIGFVGDVNTGINLAAADTIDLIGGGATGLRATAFGSQVPIGSATTPSFAFTSETSLGLYRSVASVTKHSYGWFSADLISSSTTGVSGATARLANQGQLFFSVLSVTSNGAEFGFRSGNTVYRFFSDAVG